MIIIGTSGTSKEEIEVTKGAGYISSITLQMFSCL